MEEARRHAVVIGASMGGLLAARVLADAFEQVTVVDRDALPAVGEQRKGVPQGRHAHGLLARGREVMEQLFPGMTAGLVARGAILGDPQERVRWCNDGHRLCQVPSGMVGLCVSRPLLEGHLRHRLAALADVEVRDGWSVSGLVTTAGRDRVTGIRGAGPDGRDRTLAADLVVDASGRGSRSPAWLADLGYDRPEDETVAVGIGYATRTYRRRDGDIDGDVGVVMAPTLPAGRAGVMLALEDDRWVVTLGGYGDDRPPTDPAAWVAYARSLPSPDIARVVEGGEPLDDPLAFRYPASTRRRYERLARFPAGYLVFGDALCSVNPIYGQGMTVSAVEALELRDWLDLPGAPASRFFRRAARVIDVPWDMAVGADLRFDHVAGRRTPKVRMVNRYLGRLHPVAARDPEVGRAFLRVVNLLDPPERLMAPSVAWRVLRGRGRRSPGSPAAVGGLAPEQAAPAA